MRKTYIVIWALIMTVTAFAQPEGMATNWWTTRGKCMYCTE